MSWRTTEWRKRVIDRAPIPLLTQAHEVFLAVALLIIGAGLAFGPVNPESVVSRVPEWMSQGWALTLFTGSVLTLWGLFGNRPRLEWGGQLLLGWGTFFYAVAILTGPPLAQGAVSGSVFLGVAFVSWWRSFKITSAPLLQYRLTRAAREAHVRATDERRDGRTK